MNNKVHVQVLGEFFFSQLQGIPIYDRERQRVGELRDLAIRWEGETPKSYGHQVCQRGPGTYPGGAG